MSDYKEQVIQAVRATLISVKGSLTIADCNRDYRQLQGEWIPFKKLGYAKLEELFLDVPGFKVSQNNGVWYVDAIASQDNQHIADMVSKQKQGKKATRIKYTKVLPKKAGPWRKPAPPADNYNSGYNNQYYRIKGGTPYHNNNYYGADTYKFPNYKTKSNETSPNTKQVPKMSHDQPERSSLRVQRQTSNSTNSVPASPVPVEEIKHSKPITKTEIKNTGKISASQRLSNLRERLNTVDLIPLQMPATYNIKPEVETEPMPTLEEPPELTNPIVKLEWTCRKLGLPEPIFKVHSTQAKGGPASYDCNVKVGTTYSVSSYPESSPTEELAKEVAAVKLLGEIEGSEFGGLPTSSPSKAADALADLVADHEAGLFLTFVPHLYREKYKENLPSNWQALIDHSPRIKKDCYFNGRIVLLPNPSDLSEIALQAPSSLLDLSNMPDDTIGSDLPPLKFPSEDYWNVFITVANSTLEIWLRIIGPEYSDVFESLLISMGNYYQNGGTPVDRSMLIINAWYAVNLDDGGWQRAKLMEIDEETATVFLGDHGDDDIVSLDKIKILEPQFRKLPAQAVLCRLEGAEELSATESGVELARRRLVGEVLVAAPGLRADPADPAVPLTLYDTSTHRDLNLNTELVRDFAIAGAFNITQKPQEVEVGCVSDEGCVWVVRAGGTVSVSAALALLASGPYRRPFPPAPLAPVPCTTTLYMVRTLAGDWVRCCIISGLDGEGTVRTQLIDSGLVLRAPLSSLVPLANFSPALSSYPPQAVQVRLGPAERAAGAMARLLRELLMGARVVCRALSPHGPAAPRVPQHVELFVRTGPKNILASVNNAVLMEYEYLHTKKDKERPEEKDSSVDIEALNRKKERIFRSSSSSGPASAANNNSNASDDRRPPLPSLILPTPGKCFDLYISMAASPWNFIVQPNVTRVTLTSMMESLQKECPKISESDAPKNPASGELYTVYYDKDSSWYRIIIAGVVSSEMVSVYFCDYGDLALFPTRSLRPVPEGAPLAKTLPPQAIKARLYDVCPLHQDWNVEDCIRFQELCVEQQFVGVCKEVTKDPLNPSEPLLILDLIDTSTDDDIYVNQQLVAEGRAKLSSTS